MTTSLRDIYHKQITNAGPDGLDPVAKQLMDVGLKIVHSQEDFNVSNEGLWQNIKVLFGANKEEVPEIKTIFDETLETIRRTYGNRDWLERRKLNTGEVKVKIGKEAIDMGLNTLLDRIKEGYEPVLEFNTKEINEGKIYVTPYIKFLTTGDIDSDKAKELNKLFDNNQHGQFKRYGQMNFGSNGKVKALDLDGILKMAKFFEDVVEYRRKMDIVWTTGFYALGTTDSGKLRFGKNGTVTAKLDGSAKDLAVKVGEYLDEYAIEYYGYVAEPWGTLTDLASTALSWMEASAR